MAVSGIDIDAALNGAKEAAKDDETEACLRLAAVRRAIQDTGKSVEVIGCFEPSVDSFIQWILQLYGESEGKDGKGIFPTGVSFSRDLHSLGQFFQQGNPIFTETFIDIANPVADLVPAPAPATGNSSTSATDSSSAPTAGNPSAPTADNSAAPAPDNSSLFAGRGMNEFNRAVRDGVTRAHRDADIPIVTITLPDQSAETFGRIVYFLELTCGVTGLLMGVDPFNQPGVEAYKKEMMAILRG
jgi:glucose-6-phosphate isomerase